MALIAELKRRKVLKVGGAYLVVAWLVIQVVATLAPQMQLPNWVPRTITLILLVGFPVALAMAWFFDITPEGIVRDPVDVAAEEPVAVIEKSIAVLAFSDLSATHDQEYFSDGMAEEILNALAKIRELKVAGRTSSFYYKGRNEDLRSIGKTLRVAHVLEGSVRKQGDKVRITAQLVRSEDGFHLWSETYDGELGDVFALQERIARAITHELEIMLHGAQQEQLVPVATENPEAYALYLQATSIFNRRDGARMHEGIAQLIEAVRLDPEFARGHARLAALHALAASYRSTRFGANVDAAEEHAHRALGLDATLAEPHGVLGLVHEHRRNYAEQRDAFERALALDPDDANVNYWYAMSLVCTGYATQGNAMLDRVLEIDPIMAIALLWRGLGFAYTGDMRSADRVLRRAADVGLGHVGFGLAIVAEARGNREEAIIQETTANRFFMSDFPGGSPEVFARGVYGDSFARAEAVVMIDNYLAVHPPVVNGIAVATLLRLGQAERALRLLQDGPTNNDQVCMQFLWSPYGKIARALPAFPEFARQIGLAALWDRRGAPDLCHKNADGDYVCD